MIDWIVLPFCIFLFPVGVAKCIFGYDVSESGVISCISNRIHKETASVTWNCRICIRVCISNIWILSKLSVNNHLSSYWYFTYLAYSWGYGDEYHVEISCFPNWIARGDLKFDNSCFQIHEIFLFVIQIYYISLMIWINPSYFSLTYLAVLPGLDDDKWGTATWEGTPWDVPSDLIGLPQPRLPGDAPVNLEFSLARKSLAASCDLVKNSRSLSLTPAGKFWFRSFLSFSGSTIGYLHFNSITFRLFLLYLKCKVIFVYVLTR